MSKNSQAEIYKKFNIPPSRANIKVSGSLTTVSNVNSAFLQAGLTAEDLEPIDWRKKVSLSPVLNQGNCGDCWAMSSTSALTDRFIIQKKINNLLLEPAVTAQCAGNDQGCGGGQPFIAGQFFENSGVPSVDENCPQWEKICPSNGSSCTLPVCSTLKSECDSSILYFAKQGSTKNLFAVKTDGTVDIDVTIANIKRELLNGPVVAAFFVTYDFIVGSDDEYKWRATNGIYINGSYSELFDLLPEKMASHGIKDAKTLGDIIFEGGQPAGHAVSIVGWDKATINGKEVQYWIVRNSWGTGWNEDGFFRIAMNDGSGNNTLLGFDVPVSKISVRSTGVSQDAGGYFGSCVAFDPNLDTGGQPNTGGQPSTGDKSSSKNIIIIIVAIILLVLIIAMILYFFRQRLRRIN